MITFADTDNPSEKQQREVMEEFERLAFAGLEGNQYDILSGAPDYLTKKKGQ